MEEIFRRVALEGIHNSDSSCDEKEIAASDEEGTESSGTRGRSNSSSDSE